jgi:hypothetical protein
VALCGLLASAASGRTGRALGQSPQGSSAGLASATLEQCSTVGGQGTHAATFDGQMSAVPGTRRMAMQIVLQEQAPGETAFHTLAAAPGGWRRSEAGVRIFKYVRQVTDLPEAGSFRALVLFRWLGVKGRVIKRAVRRTPACVQPDQRPKLVVARVLASTNGGYAIAIRNEGRGAAGPFAVALSVDGAAQPPLEVKGLAAGAHSVLDTPGPSCEAGGSVEVTLDPQHRVAEAPGGGESDTLPCPLAQPASATRA